MKALVSTIVLIVLVLLGVLINKKSVAPTIDDLVDVEVESVAPIETEAPATTTASTTEII